MVDFSSWPGEEEELYSLPDHDPLGVLSSTRKVILLSKHVWINPKHVEQLSKQWLQENAGNTSTYPPASNLAIIFMTEQNALSTGYWF